METAGSRQKVELPLPARWSVEGHTGAGSSPPAACFRGRKCVLSRGSHYVLVQKPHSEEI